MPISQRDELIPAVVPLTLDKRTRSDFAAFIPDGDISRFADQMRESLKIRFDETMAILRDKKFQELLYNYDRAKNPFYVAYGTQDTVSSEFVFKVADKQLKPRDYLVAFSEFVHANKDKINALSILLNNPRRWNSQALKEIRQELKKNAFDEEKVRKAHELSGHKALADIISLIKNADSDQNPLLTATERVNRTLADIMAKHHFNEEQKQWLNYIKEYLIINLAIEKDNFDVEPILERHGGLAKARRIFGDKLDNLIAEINYKLAA